MVILTLQRAPRLFSEKSQDFSCYFRKCIFESLGSDFGSNKGQGCETMGLIKRKFSIKGGKNSVLLLLAVSAFKGQSSPKLNEF